MGVTDAGNVHMMSHRLVPTIWVTLPAPLNAPAGRLAVGVAPFPTGR